MHASFRLFKPADETHGYKVLNTHMWSLRNTDFLFAFGCAGSLPEWAFLSSWGPLSSCGLSTFYCRGFLLESKDSRMNRLRQLQQVGSPAVATGSGAQAQQLWPTGFAVPQQVGSSWIRDRTHVSYTGRWILYHGANREAHNHWFRLDMKNSLACLCIMWESWKIPMQY